MTKSTDYLNRFHFLSTILLLGGIFYFISIITQANYSDFQPISFHQKSPVIPISELCLEQDSITDNDFPYQKYLNHTDYTAIPSLEKQISELDSFTHNRFLSQSILVNALTEKALFKLQTSNLDSLNMLLNWADDLKAYSNFSSENSLVFQAVYEYWYAHVASTLNHRIKENPSEKYHFKYRYLAQRCADKLYLPNTGNTLIEKVFLNIIDQNWAYLFHRFWYSTSWFFKIIVLSLGILFLVISYLNFQFLIKQITSWKEKTNS